MNILKHLSILLLMLLLFIPTGAHAQDGTATPVVILLEHEGPVTPAMAEYLERGIRLGETRGAELVVFQINTPGGSFEITEQMVGMLLQSQVPVVVYVSPHGGMAASAGTIISLAAHASAMAPGSAIGAASPVGGQGEDLPTTEAQKLKNFMQAQVRSLAQRRGEKAVRFAEDTIASASAASAEEALQMGLVDFIAVDIHDLLRQLNGFQVQVMGETRTLNTTNAVIQTLQTSIIEKLLQVLTNPNVVFILLTIGVQAILIELSSPGGWVAGFLGVVCLALATYGLGILPVNWFGLIFLATAFVLFILDIKAPTHGALTIAGASSLILGALVLFNSPGTPVEFQVSPWLVIAVSVTTAVTFGLFVSFAIRAQKVPVRTGREAIASGKQGIVRADLNPQGTVQMAGELWTAELEPGSEPACSGEHVQIVRVEGNRLIVRKIKDPVRDD
jgi:membrane-bound serine protease (ClpP class)